MRNVNPGMWLFGIATFLLSASLMASQPPPLQGRTSLAWLKLQQHFKAIALTPNAQPLRILHLGDSHTAGIAFSGRLRRLFQQRFPDSGPGFLPPAELSGHDSGPFRIHQVAGWVSGRERKLDHAGSGALGGFFAYSQRPYQFVSYTLSRVNQNAHLILYTDPEQPDRPARFKVYYDQQEIKPVTISSNGRALYKFSTGNGQLDILSRVGGEQPRLRALNLLYDTPGVSYCSLGVNGATFNILQEWRGTTTSLEMADYKPDLLILEFGTNDVLAPGFSKESFLITLGQTETWIRTFAKDAAVLFILPPGMLKHDVRSEQNLDTLRAMILSISEKKGWLVWDWYLALNRRDQSRVWTASHYGPDGVHLNRAGYAQSASWLFDALGHYF